MLRNTPSRQMEKAAIAKRLHLRDANLSRILRLMTNARFVERTTPGKFALFALTRGGLLELERREKRETKNRDRLPAQVRETFARVGAAHPARCSRRGCSSGFLQFGDTRLGAHS
ncbi:hypothetical protein IVB48_11905 [Bradyrhizobium sp. 76]|nr:hypothetical protein [Bradyrhizobium sp. 76]